MSRRSRVTATYKPSEFELYEVTVSAASGYPDAIAEARAQAVRGVKDMLAESLNAYREFADAETTGDEFEAIVAGADEDEPETD